MSEDNKQEEVKTPDEKEKSVVGTVVGAVAYTMAVEATRSGIRWLRDHKEDIRNFFNRNNEQVAENSATNNTAEQNLQNNQATETNQSNVNGQDLQNAQDAQMNGMENLEMGNDNVENVLAGGENVLIPHGKEKFIQMLAKYADFSHLNPENVASKGENVEDNVEEKGFKDEVIRWGRVIIPVVATAMLRYALGDEIDLGNDNQVEVENNSGQDVVQNEEIVQDVVESVEPPTLTDEQRQELIEQLSREDAQEFTRVQGVQLRDNIMQIQEYDDRYEEAYERILGTYEEEREAFLRDCGYNDALSELSRLSDETEMSRGEYLGRIRELKDEYGVTAYDERLIAQVRVNLANEGLPYTPDQFANRITGLGNGEENYCIAIQTNAMEDAVRETGNDTLGGVRDGVGWTTQYASNFFVENGFGENFERMDQLFTLNEDGEAIVNMDENGNPMIRDGDLAIVDNNHCIRLNVDENGVVTYSAGNNERIEAPARWFNDSCCTLIRTEDYATSLMQQQYQEMTDEQLLALNNQRHPSTNENSIDETLLAYAPKSVDMEYENEKGMDTTERRLLSSELKRAAKYTLEGTLPLSCSRELREWNGENTRNLNDRVDNYEASRGRENANSNSNSNSNISTMIKASAERA